MKEAGESLASLHEVRMRKVIQSYLGRRPRRFWRGDVEDYLQVAWLRVLGRLHYWTNTGKFCHWLIVVIKRSAIDYDKPIMKITTNLEQIPEPARQANVQTVLAIQERAAQLPKEVYNLYKLKIDGHSNEDIQHSLKISKATFFRRLAILRDWLKPCLGESSHEVVNAVDQRGTDYVET